MPGWEQPAPQLPCACPWGSCSGTARAVGVVPAKSRPPAAQVLGPGDPALPPAAPQGATTWSWLFQIVCTSSVDGLLAVNSVLAALRIQRQIRSGPNRSDTRINTQRRPEQNGGETAENLQRPTAAQSPSLVQTSLGAGDTPHTPPHSRSTVSAAGGLFASVTLLPGQEPRPGPERSQPSHPPLMKPEHNVGTILFVN